jgi:hypothetical protein
MHYDKPRIIRTVSAVAAIKNPKISSNNEVGTFLMSTAPAYQSEE